MRGVVDRIARRSRTGGLVAFLLGLGLFLGWLTAPDFVRQSHTLAAAVSQPRSARPQILEEFAARVQPSLPVGADDAALHAEVFDDAPVIDSVVHHTDVFIGDEETLVYDGGEEGIEEAGVTPPRPRQGDEPEIAEAGAFESAGTGDGFDVAGFDDVQLASYFPGGVAGAPGASPASNSDPTPLRAAASEESNSPAAPPDEPGNGGNQEPPDDGRGGADDLDIDPGETLDSVAELLIKFLDGSSEEDVVSFLAANDAEVVECYTVVDYCLVRVPTTGVAGLLDLVSSIAANPLIAGVQPNSGRRAADGAFDPLFPMEWSHNNFGVGGRPDADIDNGEAWNVMLPVTSRTRVAVLDTGFDLQHSDLKSVIATSRSVVGRNVTDNAEHGTQVAGILAALGDNAIGIAGVNKKWASLELIQVFAEDDTVYDSDLLRGLQAMTSGVRVVNLSIAGEDPSPALCEAIASRRDILFVAAAGNATSSVPNYPAACSSSNLISVASTDRFDLLAATSSFGTWVDLAAPGDQILTTIPGSLFGPASGTSMAVPHVAGVASMMLAKDPTLGASAVRSKIIGAVDKLTQLSLFVASGGRLNACRALEGVGCTYLPGLPIQ